MTGQIVPHLWFDTQAKEAADLYTSVLPDSEVTNVTTLHDTPSGDCDVVTFTLAGLPFQAISAGPEFRFTPAVSFRIDCSTEDEVDAYWNTLSEGGQVMMPLDGYPFSKRYGWCADRYGLSWQIMHTEGEIPQKVVPSLLFVGDIAGQAEDAIGHYVSVFDDAHIDAVDRYGAGEEPDREGSVRFAAFTLDGYRMSAMDSAHEHAFTFNEAVSLIVPCDTQAEMDRFSDALSAVPEAEQCGWLKDRWGLSWQIVPSRLDEMMASGDEAAVARVTQAFLQMKRFDLSALEEAYRAG